MLAAQVPCGDYLAACATWQDSDVVYAMDLSESGHTMFVIAGGWKVENARFFTCSGHAYAIDLRTEKVIEVHAPNASEDWKLLDLRALGGDDLLLLSERGLRWFRRRAGEPSWSLVHRARLTQVRSFGVGLVGGKWMACVLAGPRVSFFTPAGDKLVLLGHLERRANSCRPEDGAFLLEGSDGAWTREVPPTLAPPAKKERSSAQIGRVTLSLVPAPYPPAPPHRIRSRVPCAKLGFPDTKLAFVQEEENWALGLRFNPGDSQHGDTLLHWRDGTLRSIALPGGGDFFTTAPDGNRAFVTGPSPAPFSNHILDVDLIRGVAREVLKDAYEYVVATQWMTSLRVVLTLRELTLLVGAIVCDLDPATGEWVVRDRIKLKNSEFLHVDPYRSRVAISSARLVRFVPVSPDGRFGTSRSVPAPEVPRRGFLSLRFTPEHAYVGTFRNDFQEVPDTSFQVEER